MYTLGSINNNWPDDFNFPWKKQTVIKELLSSWKDLGYNVSDYCGWMFDNTVPMPDWVYEVGQNFPDLQNKAYKIYKMKTGEIMPTHTDHYTTYANLFNVSRDRIYRVLVFLQDWSPGHYFEIENKGVVNWRRGDWYKWSCDTPHAASNIGIKPRYTLQITGHV